MKVQSLLPFSPPDIHSVLTSDFNVTILYSSISNMWFVNKLEYLLGICRIRSY